MSHAYRATVSWRLPEDEDFTSRRYSRAHDWRFDGGITVPASSSPSIVPLPWSRADAVDPEEAFVAALSSCHMLFFLHHAANAGLEVLEYVDDAVGTMGRDTQGRTAIREVCLHPVVRCRGAAPPAEQLRSLHEAAHGDCFLASSVAFPIRIEPFESGS